MKLSDFALGEHVLLSGDHGPFVFTVTERREDSPYTFALVTLERRPHDASRVTRRFLSEDDMDSASVSRVSPWRDLFARLPELLRVTGDGQEGRGLEVACGPAGFVEVGTLDAEGHAAFDFSGEAMTRHALRVWLRSSRWELREDDDARRVRVALSFTRPVPGPRDDLYVRAENRAASGQSALAIARAIRSALEQVWEVEDRIRHMRAWDQERTAREKQERKAREQQERAATRQPRRNA